MKIKVAQIIFVIVIMILIAVTKKETIVEVEVIREVPIEVIKEVEIVKEIEVPVEIVKEVEIPVEVVKEVKVPVEVVKEVYVPQYIYIEPDTEVEMKIEQTQNTTHDNFDNAIYVPTLLENNERSIEGKFYGMISSNNSEEILYQFRSNDNTVWWLLTEEEIGHVPNQTDTYILTYNDNGTTKENKPCECDPKLECECEVYDDEFIKIEKK